VGTPPTRLAAGAPRLCFPAAADEHPAGVLRRAVHRRGCPDAARPAGPRTLLPAGVECVAVSEVRSRVVQAACAQHRVPHVQSGRPGGLAALALCPLVACHLLRRHKQGTGRASVLVGGSGVPFVYESVGWWNARDGVGIGIGIGVGRLVSAGNHRLGKKGGIALLEVRFGSPPAGTEGLSVMANSSRLLKGNLVESVHGH
jgi:hypothetical protein